MNKNKVMEELINSIVWLNEKKFERIDRTDEDQMMDLIREFRCLYYTAKCINNMKDEEVADNEK